MSGAAIGSAAFAGGRENRRRSDVQVGIQYAGLDQRQQQIDYRQYQDQRNFQQQTQRDQRNFQYQTQRDQRNFAYQSARDQIGDTARESELQFRAYTQQAGFQQQRSQAEQLQHSRIELQDNATQGRKEVSREKYAQEESRTNSQIEAIRHAMKGEITEELGESLILQKQAGLDKIYPKEVKPLSQMELQDSLVREGTEGIIAPGDIKSPAHGFYTQEQDKITGEWRVKGFVNTQPDQAKRDPSAPSFSDTTARNKSRADYGLKIGELRSNAKIKYLGMTRDLPDGADGEKKWEQMFTAESAAAEAAKDYPMFDRSGGDVQSGGTLEEQQAQQTAPVGTGDAAPETSWETKLPTTSEQWTQEGRRLKWSDVEIKFVAAAAESESMDRTLTSRENAKFNRINELKDDTPMQVQANAMILKWLLSVATKQEMQERDLNNFYLELLKSISEWRRDG